ncbi:glycosyltransferase family 2 protein [Candidatus Gottesmanbacteria bacterium]|nr:glycosyltransferase family 2 protein [Candidatus Gottesmanbacteria bacterium]
MDLSIIIPNYNTKLLLERCLRSILLSLAEEAIQYEVIVVDNASKDGSLEFVRHIYPQISLLSNKTNVGYGKANNQAIRTARGTYVLLLNSDIVVQADGIGSLYRFMLSYARIFAGGKLHNEDGTPQPSCGPFFSLPAVLLMLFLKGDYWGATRRSPRSITRVDWVSGACLMGKREAFEDVGLFDEKIFMYMEEIDLLYRAKKKGYGVLFCPYAEFIHTGAASSDNRRNPVVNIYRGLLYFYGKHYGLFSLSVLRIILKLKAYLSIWIGRFAGRTDIVSIYEKALALV